MGKLFDRAIAFATEMHAGQFRKGTRIPYIVHPMEVAAIVATVTTDDEMLAAAVLHDTLEDTPATVDQLKNLFGDRVTALVAEESENKREEYAPESTWQIRKQETLDHLSHTGHDAKVIALGDKLSNIRAIQRDYEQVGDELWDRFNQKDPRQHAWYYRALADVFRADPGLKDTFAGREYAERVRQVFGSSPD